MFTNIEFYAIVHKFISAQRVRSQSFFILIKIFNHFAWYQLSVSKTYIYRGFPLQLDATKRHCTGIVR